MNGDPVYGIGYTQSRRLPIAWSFMTTSESPVSLAMYGIKLVPIGLM